MEPIVSIIIPFYNAEHTLEACLVSCLRQTLTSLEILLIDDVFTTGSTVNECAKALKKVGVARVFVLTIARVVR